MKHNEFKDRLYEILNENDVVLRIADIDTDDFANTFTVKTRDGSIFEIETRTVSYTHLILCCIRSLMLRH